MTDDKTGPLGGADRRQAERIPAKMGVRFHGSEEVARAIKAYSLNLSVGGLCLKTQKTYDVGHPLHLALEVDGKDFSIDGVVAWVRNGTIGVRFVDVSDSVRGQLMEMISKLTGT